MNVFIACIVSWFIRMTTSELVYSDDHVCPVLIQKRLKHERREALYSKKGLEDFAI